jgi:hypothetical protein
MAGVSSIFSSEDHIMLTEAVPCADHGTDRHLLATLGLRPRVLEGVADDEGTPVTISA